MSSHAMGRLSKRLTILITNILLFRCYFTEDGGQEE
jgi:hypothetical protein